MKRSLRIRSFLVAPAVAVGVVGFTQFALASLSTVEVVSRYAALGYEVLRIKIDDGVYEIAVRDANGIVVELYVDAGTGELVADGAVDDADDDDPDDVDDDDADDADDDDADDADDGDADDADDDDVDDADDGDAEEADDGDADDADDGAVDDADDGDAEEADDGD